MGGQGASPAPARHTPNILEGGTLSSLPSLLSLPPSSLPPYHFTCSLCLISPLTSHISLSHLTHSLSHLSSHTPPLPSFPHTHTILLCPHTVFWRWTPPPQNGDLDFTPFPPPFLHFLGLVHLHASLLVGCLSLSSLTLSCPSLILSPPLSLTLPHTFCLSCTYSLLSLIFCLFWTVWFAPSPFPLSSPHPLACPTTTSHSSPFYTPLCPALGVCGCPVWFTHWTLPACHCLHTLLCLPLLPSFLTTPPYHHHLFSFYIYLCLTLLPTLPSLYTHTHHPYPCLFSVGRQVLEWGLYPFSHTTLHLLPYLSLSPLLHLSSLHTYFISLFTFATHHYILELRLHWAFLPTPLSLTSLTHGTISFNSTHVWADFLPSFLSFSLILLFKKELLIKTHTLLPLSLSFTPHTHTALHTYTYHLSYSLPTSAYYFSLFMQLR